MSDTAIKIENLSKQYRLGLVSTGTLSHDLKRWWYLTLGKEDPYSKVSEVNDRSVKGTSEYVWALKDINIEVKKGEVLGIIGKNGAGKSTLLKILSKVTGPTDGSITYRGRIGSLLEVGTGFHQELTGKENIYLNGAILGMKKKEIVKKLDDIIDFSGCARYIDTPVKRYSSGMMVRLGFAVAAFLEPEILVVDEVLAVGDAEFQRKAIGKMQDVSHQDGRTVLFVSHNMASMRKLCKNGILLENGTIKKRGNIDSVCNEYLNSNSNEGFVSEIIFPGNDNIFRTTSVSLFDKDNNLNTNFECDEEIIVKIKCLLKEKIPGLYGYLDIRKTDGTIVWVSDSNDFSTNTLDKLRVGINTITIRIPARTLGVGIYNLAIAFNSNYNFKGFYVDKPGVILKFSVVDSFTQRGDNRGGFFSKLLEWEIDQNN